MKRIGIIGHIDNVKKIEKVIENEFDQIEGIPLDIQDLIQVPTTALYLKEHMHEIDGVIFTGKTIYDIMNHTMHSHNPWVFLDNDESQLQRILLTAVHKNGMKINNISIDSYSRKTIDRIYRDFGLSSEEYTAIISDVDIFQDTFLDDLYMFHKTNCEKHPDFIAITGISSVYNRLQAEKIPSMLLTPNSNAIQTGLHTLLEKIDYQDMAVSQIVVISMEIDTSSEYDMSSENEYSLMLRKTRITEEVYKFAQRIQAAVVETGKNYLLFTTKQIVEFETKNLRELAVLGSIKEKTNNTVSVGIGFGITAREAKAHALLGKDKSLKMGGNQCFVVYDRKHTERITQVDRATASSISPIDLSFKNISEKTGVSINNIYQLKCVMDIYKKDTFTSLELSEEFGNSLRSMNRIIEKLETAGYVEVVGKKIVGKAGRPSRILRLLI